MLNSLLHGGCERKTEAVASGPQLGASDTVYLHVCARGRRASVSRARKGEMRQGSEEGLMGELIN